MLDRVMPPAARKRACRLHLQTNDDKEDHRERFAWRDLFSIDRINIKLSELIQHVGDENIQLQNLDDSLVKAKAAANDGEITFATDKAKIIERAVGREPAHLGLVVWIPRERLPISMR